jgi:ABC-2 type transport system permease protein
MRRLITIEWLKNYSYFPVILFSSIYFILIIGFTLICAIDSIPILGIPVNIRSQGLLDFPQIWNFLTYISALLKIFLGFIIIFTISNEFSQKMFKQNIIDGLSKREFVFSKVITITILSLLSTFIVLIMGLILGLNHSKSTDLSLIFQEFYFIFGYLLKLFTFLSFLFFITVLLKRVVFVFLTFFVWWIIELILFISEYQSKNIVEKFDENGRRITEMPELITNYLPLNSMSSLIQEPFQRIQFVNKITGGSFTFEIPYESILACIIYSALFICGSYLILKRRDW